VLRPDLLLDAETSRVSIDVDGWRQVEPLDPGRRADPQRERPRDGGIELGVRYASPTVGQLGQNDGLVSRSRYADLERVATVEEVLEKVEMSAATDEIASVEVEGVIDGVELIVAAVACVEGIVLRRPVGPRAALAIQDGNAELRGGVGIRLSGGGPQSGIRRVSAAQADVELEFIGPRRCVALKLGSRQNRWQAPDPKEQKQDPASCAAGRALS